MLDGRAVRQGLKAPKRGEASGSDAPAEPNYTLIKNSGDVAEKAKKVAKNNIDCAAGTGETRQNGICGPEIDDTTARENEKSDFASSHKARKRPVPQRLVSSIESDDSSDMPDSRRDKPIKPVPIANEARSQKPVSQNEPRPPHRISVMMASKAAEVGPKNLTPRTGNNKPTDATKQLPKQGLAGPLSCAVTTAPKDDAPWETTAQPRILQDKDGFRYCVELTRTTDEMKWVLSLYESTSATVPKTFRFCAVLQNARCKKVLDELKDPSPILDVAREQFNRFFFQKTGYAWTERLLRVKIPQPNWRYRAPAKEEPTGKVPSKYTPGHPDCVQDLGPTIVWQDLSRGNQVKKERSTTEGPQHQHKTVKDARWEEILRKAKAYRSVGLGRQDQLQKKRKANDASNLEPQRQLQKKRKSDSTSLGFERPHQSEQQREGDDILNLENQAKVPKSKSLAPSRKDGGQTILVSLETSKVGQNSTVEGIHSEKATTPKASATNQNAIKSSNRGKGGRILSNEFVTASDDVSD